MFTSRIAGLALLIGSMIGCAESPALTHVDGLGSLSFPNSGMEEAQEPFLRGVLLLHSFEFEPAREAFSEAQDADSLFALAYWGEAMANNYPLWQSKNVDEGRAILARMDSLGAVAPSHRETMYIEAVRALYGDGTKTEQDLVYMESMKALQDMHPEDHEARAFHALSILGSTDGVRDFDVYARAAAVAQPVFDANPNHPGAAHYIIHSYDDPEHADLGLDAANAYSDIAPGAAHAQHMTTHIFLARGDWERVIQNNQRAMDVQNADMVERGRDPVGCGHYSSWLHYGHLQLEQWEQAEALMDACHAQAAETDRWGTLNYFQNMRSQHVLVSGDWSLTDRWTLDLETFPEEFSIWKYAATNAFALLASGRVDDARTWLPHVEGEEELAALTRMQLEGLVAIADGDAEGGLAMMQEAAEAEAAMPFEFGPPRLPMPGHEAWGNALLMQGMTDEAQDVLAFAESRTPGRLTLARARAAMATE
ncbi:MAG: hypothetical protein ACPG3U_03870 [Rhodothermales bacterium]